MKYIFEVRIKVIGECEEPEWVVLPGDPGG